MDSVRDRMDPRVATLTSAAAVTTAHTTVSTTTVNQPKRLKTWDPALLSAVPKEATPTLEEIPSELFIQYFLPFVGCHQYRFVAAVNHNFHSTYVTAFPETVTYFNLTTMEHAKICYDESKGQYHDPLILCYIAA
jgi:hypothetical protein